ncbi:hypothetical protein BRC2024_KCUCJSVR_CDS_0006 [Acinetobacter phage vB_AbaM_KissB]
MTIHKHEKVHNHVPHKLKKRIAKKKILANYDKNIFVSIDPDRVLGFHRLMKESSPIDIGVAKYLHKWLRVKGRNMKDLSGDMACLFVWKSTSIGHDRFSNVAFQIHQNGIKAFEDFELF